MQATRLCKETLRDHPQSEHYWFRIYKECFSTSPKRGNKDLIILEAPLIKDVNQHVDRQCEEFESLESFQVSSSNLAL